MELGAYKGIALGINDIIVSRLQFADDNILFYEPTMDMMIIIKDLLWNFQAASGVMLNVTPRVRKYYPSRRSFTSHQTCVH